jgi:hypothetical protein
MVMTVIMPLSMIQKINSAIPPISSQSLNELSDYIVIGKVTRIESSRGHVRSSTNQHYKVLVKVEQVESKKSNLVTDKGQFSRLKNFPSPGSTIEVYYRIVSNRSTGWFGLQGQNSHLKEGISAKLFIRKDPQGTLRLLEPNGWKLIDQEVVK